MSKAIYCDHCENLFTDEQIKTIKIEPFYNEDLKLDLCKDCHDQLEAWIYSKLNVEEYTEETENDALQEDVAKDVSEGGKR